MKNRGHGATILIFIIFAAVLVFFTLIYSQKPDKREQEMLGLLHKNRLQIEELEKNIAILNGVLSEKKIESENLKMENTKSYGQDEQIKYLQSKIDELLNMVSDAELALLESKKELIKRNDEIMSLEKELQDLKIAASESIMPVPSQKSLRGNGVRVRTLFKDKEFNNLIEILAEKEDQIKQLENELALFKSEEVSGKNISQGLTPSLKAEDQEAKKSAIELRKKVEVLLDSAN